MSKKIVISGRPGIGKTTVFKKVVDRLRSRGYYVVGFYCPEVRVRGSRIGFRIISLDDVVEEWLAHISNCSGPKIGKYRVCYSAEKVAKHVISRISEASILAIDEIGPMELKLPSTRNAIIEMLKADKPGIYVAHYRLSDKEILYLLRDSTKYIVNEYNRNSIVDKIFNEIMDLLR